MKKASLFVILLVSLATGAAYAQNQPYFGVKAGIMMPDPAGVDDALNIGGVVGMKIQDLQPSSGMTGSISVEGEATLTLIDGDVRGGGDWDVFTLAGYGVYRSPPLNSNMYFKGKAGLAYLDFGPDDDFGLSLGVGLGFKMGARNSLEFEFTVFDDVDFLSVGYNF